MQEQRKHKRYTVQLAAEVDVGGEIAVASTQNVSSGGVGLVLDRALKDGRKVRVTLFLTQDGIEDPDEQPFEATAMVMWSAEQDAGTWAAGVKFEQVSDAQKKQLERFLAAIG